MKTILITFLCLFCISNAMAFDFESKQIQNLHDKLMSKNDTFVCYFRTCSACDANPAHEVYFFYIKRGKIKLEVYRWRRDNIPLKVYSQKEKNGNLRNQINFLIKHFDSINSESKNHTPFNTREDLGNGIIRVGERSSHGPLIKYTIKLGKKLISSSILNLVVVSDLEGKLPYSTQMIKGFHDIYSMFSKSQVIDDPE